MKRILILVLALGAVSFADKEGATDGKRVISFRLKEDVTSTMRGWLLDHDEEGFRFQEFGGGRKLRIAWADLYEADATKLRQELGLELTEDERLGLIPGHEVFFKGGGSVRGILVEVDGTGQHHVRTAGLVLPYPKDRIDRVEEVKVKEDEAYSPEEIYIRRLSRRPPSTAGEHRALADYLYDIGNWDDAVREYNSALEKEPSLRADLEPRLAELADYMEDKAASVVFKLAKKEAHLDGKWAKAIADIEASVEANPGSRRRGLRIIDELEERWLDRKRAVFHRVKNEELDRTVRRYIARHQPDIGTARSWVTSQLDALLRNRIRSRLELSKDELEMFAESKAKGAPHWTTYSSGTFVIAGGRVKLGKSTSKTVRGDPDKWWATYNDVNTRASWLKAYAAERLPLFEVVQIRPTDCTRCGGTGQVDKMSLKALPDGRHEWRETCPRCFGARTDRGVGYK